jgi:hypothetical protein
MPNPSAASGMDATLAATQTFPWGSDSEIGGPYPS